MRAPIAVALCIVAGCSTKDPAAAKPAPTAAPAQASAPAPAAASASAPSGPASPAAGAWAGKFDAKKSDADIGEKAKKADDGKRLSGAGEVTLTVSPSGDISGASSGALGASTLRGRVETADGRTMVRASVISDAPDGMRGVLVGEMKGDVVEAHMNVANGDATLAREATFELKRSAK